MKNSLQNIRQPRILPGFLGEKAKVIAMGLLLGTVLFLWFLPDTRVPTIEGPSTERLHVDLSSFELDQKILAKVKDGSTAERALIEEEPLAHLLKKSLNIVPTVAKALNLPDLPVSVERLRKAPHNHRGEFLWYKGKLVTLSEGREGHPVGKYKIYEGHLRTPEGEDILCFFSLPPDPKLTQGSWVRIEGFFMKLHDKHYPESVPGAPVLVGPRLFPAHPDWEAIEKLDPAVLAQVQNAYQKDGEWVNTRDMDRMLLNGAEDVPLWHVASFARNNYDKETGDNEIDDTEILETKEQLDTFRLGHVRQGALYRLRGLFVWSQTFRANINPVGIDYWSEVWIQIPRIGGKTFPIWVCKDVGDWHRNEEVDIYGYFYKNYRYTGLQNDVRFTPLFVAAEIKRFIIPTHPITKWVALAFACFVFSLTVVFFMMARRHKKDSEEHEARLVERRRRRRSKAPRQASLES